MQMFFFPVLLCSIAVALYVRIYVSAYISVFVPVSTLPLLHLFVACCHPTVLFIHSFASSAILFLLP